ncbi:MAG TPA: pteridine-dependent deoxygenase [Rhodanobacteraceae bacterium]|nr:pteridine-dependent deoxygenase [Rhodanobacteraceae bacterium]
MPELPTTLPPLRIEYSSDAPTALLKRADVLAVIAFEGTATADADPRFVRIGLEIIGDPVVEVWRAKGPVNMGREGRVCWSSDGDYGFFAIEIEENTEDGIAAAAEHAYRDLVSVIQASATPNVLRIWNYFDAINLGEGDNERYRRFCVGRASGMSDSRQDRYPAATAIGRRDGVRVIQIYALTARCAGVPVENPRQVNAWLYPRQYGPIAPTFARGMITAAGQLLISGTAAVVGSASRHEDDVAAQLDETITNIASLIRTAVADTSAVPGTGSVLKIYVRRRADAARVVTRLREIMGVPDGLVILHGDICRRELLVEIDGIHV